jgi:ribosomal protein L7/L12
MNQLSSTTEALVDEREWEKVLTQLRADGFSPVESIKITRAVLHKSLTEAKRIVHFSEAWSDQRAQFGQLHDDVSSAARSL